MRMFRAPGRGTDVAVPVGLREAGGSGREEVTAPDGSEKVPDTGRFLSGALKPDGPHSAFLQL